jgi:hypothetical protein
MGASFGVNARVIARAMPEMKLLLFQRDMSVLRRNGVCGFSTSCPATVAAPTVALARVKAAVF